MNNIVFCRHGETKFNLEDRFQGFSDSPLTARGIETAKKLNKFLMHNFDIKDFYLSPLPRVIQTYKIAAEGITAKVNITNDLREVCYGDWEGKKRSSIDPALLQRKKMNKFEFVHPGSYHGNPGESYRTEYDRIYKFLTKLKPTGDTVVIAHQGVLVCVLKYYGNYSDKDASQLKFSNDQVIIIKKADGDSINQIEFMTV